MLETLFGWSGMIATVFVIFDLGIRMLAIGGWYWGQKDPEKVRKWRALNLRFFLYMLLLICLLLLSNALGN